MQQIRENAILGTNDKKSLNRDFRKKELMKITLENYDFLKRLGQKQSCYSITKFEEDYKQKEILMRSLSEFPEFYGSGDRASAP
eukprot:CAMPEP_0202960242 /NCGR_PEP_ID=MMETSP1396-20130829/4391_1 /ASSEMBLY_ACC=CAM_ASM_000872 /TAXON_ID= /ORGANISM="Pseudokeronopsis sp., Strain Brazil" /LENGTH=83 /DNA_ID=CAMNT_0049679331 /DNA_START=232 /DNA_END=483 /DNA_ORIENTATION=-